MAFVQFSKVSLAFGDRDILRDVSLNLQAGTKAALTGANGAGKSTLIKILAGISEPDSGTRVAEKGARLAYLPQSGLVHHGCTLREEADKAFAWGYELQAECDRIGTQLQSCKAGSGEEERLALVHSELLSKLESSGWYNRQSAAEQVLVGLGFSKADFDKATDCFSGGWQMRIALAKALMANPDILLLDEPTNYLDLEARNWLEKFLSDFSGGFLLVSHDRYFLDHTINEVYELFGGSLKRYPGNFSHYEKVRATELETLMAEYEKQQQEIAHLEDFINRFGYKATKAAQAQERQKMLDKILANKIEIPESLKKIHFSFPQAPHSGQLVLTLEKICKSYGGPNVISNLDLVLEKNERLVVAGRNGAGKSTLLRIVSGHDSDFTGTVKLGSGVSIGYFSQDSAEKITGSQTVLQYMEERCPLDLIPKLRDMLGAFLFRGDDVFKSISVLSGGEKSRIALLELLLRPVNLLVLDEPTNHLDMHSKDVLLEALKDFGGTVIFVSHDRGFIEGLATRVLELTGDREHDGHWRTFPGDYVYYQERLEAEAKGLIVSVNKVTQENVGSATKLSWEEQKKQQSERRKIEREVERLEKEIALAEEEKKVLEEELSRPEVYSDGAKSKSVQEKIDQVTQSIDQLTQKWEAAAEQLA